MGFSGSNITSCNSPTIGNDKSTYSAVFDATMGVIDTHDHTTTKGVQIPTGGLADGAVTTAKLADGSVNGAKQAARNKAVGTTTGAFATSSGSTTEVTACSVALTSIGRPTLVMLNPELVATALGESYFGISPNSGGTVLSGTVNLYRGATKLASFQFENSNLAPGGYVGDILIPPGSLNILDASPPAGSNTYTLKVKPENNHTDFYIGFCQLVAIEL